MEIYFKKSSGGIQNLITVSDKKIYEENGLFFLIYQR